MTVQNLASLYIRRSAAALLEGNWALVADCMAEDFHMEDRRLSLAVTLDKAEAVAMTRVMGDLGVTSIEVEDLETRGKHHALFRITNYAQDFMVCTLSVAKVREDERAVALVIFDEDALDAARAELESLAEGT